MSGIQIFTYMSLIILHAFCRNSDRRISVGRYVDRQFWNRHVTSWKTLRMFQNHPRHTNRMHNKWLSIFAPDTIMLSSVFNIFVFFFLSFYFSSQPTAPTMATALRCNLLLCSTSVFNKSCRCTSTSTSTSQLSSASLTHLAPSSFSPQRPERNAEHMLWDLV